MKLDWRLLVLKNLVLTIEYEIIEYVFRGKQTVEELCSSDTLVICSHRA